MSLNLLPIKYVHISVFNLSPIVFYSCSIRVLFLLGNAFYFNRYRDIGFNSRLL
jgi:hypothetical protein